MVFKKEDGFLTKDFLQYGIDHLASGLHLLEMEAKCYDSAGYLISIGFEMILKAIKLHLVGEFKSAHGFQLILASINKENITLELNEFTETIEIIDEFKEMRYPNPKVPIEIGSNMIDDIKSLYHALCKQLPVELIREIEVLKVNNKGGRILLKKNKT